MATLTLHNLNSFSFANPERMSLNVNLMQISKVVLNLYKEFSKPPFCHPVLSYHVE